MANPYLDQDPYGDLAQNVIPKHESFLNRMIKGVSSGMNLSEPERVAFKTGSGILGGAPQAILQNPVKFAMGGVAGAGGGAFRPEVNLSGELEPRTFTGGAISNVVPLLIGAGATGAGIAKGISALKKFPYKKVLDMRKSIPEWVKKNTTKYGEELETLVSKSPSGGKVPASEATNIYAQFHDDPVSMAQLNPKLRAKIVEGYQEFATNPNKQIDVFDLITRKRELSKLIPRAKRFDVNEHAISEIGKATGNVLENYIPGVKDLNLGYKKFYDLKDLANKIFKPWESIYNTGTGEGVLKSLFKVKHDVPIGTRLGLKALGKETGINTTTLPGLIRAAKLVGGGAGILGAGEFTRRKIFG